jgi:hypothetical protein
MPRPSQTRSSTDELPPLYLSDEQMSAVLAASHPIAPARRVDFFVDVVRELSALPMVGDGVVHRVIVDVQRRYFDAPLEADERHRVGKYGR